MYIVGDFETTGLLKARGANIDEQPHITEVCLFKLNQDFEVVKKFITLVKPPIPIPQEVVRITGITDEMVSESPTFTLVWKDIARMFFGCHTSVFHNHVFDLSVLIFELRRIGKEHHFPYCPVQYCTKEQSMHLKGKRLQLKELHEIVTGEPEITGHHRAETDVEALVKCFKWLKEKECG